MKVISSLKIAAVFTVAVLSIQGYGANILGFFPASARSHHRVFQPLLRELAIRGHQVTYFTPFEMDGAPGNLTHILVKDYYVEMMTALGQLPDILKNMMPVLMGTFGSALGECVLKDPAFEKLINSEAKFDLILSEITVLHEVFAPLVHRFNASLVEVLPSGNLHRTWALYGNPYDTSYIIDTSVAYTDKMTLFEKVHNTYNSLLHRFLFYHCFMPKYQRIADQYFRYPGWESRPPLDELIRSASIVLVNSHHSLNYPYPQAANFKDIGGINIQPETKPMTKELKEFIDGAKDGIIYFTLGSHTQVSTILKGDLAKIFSKVFGSLKQRVLWKWETDFPDLPQNIRISKWFPQQDILAHKNIRLFITHGGFLSLTESINYGVPMIGIPLMGDQFKNTRHMEYFGYGIPLYLTNITVESLSWSINHILSNPGFMQNAKKRSDLLRDKPETALETAIYWTEYVIRHKGAEHLRPAIATMPWYQQTMIDIYSAIAAIILVSLYIIYKLTRCFFRLICRCGSTKKEASNKKRKTQ